jgi:hypothetical protein
MRLASDGVAGCSVVLGVGHLCSRRPSLEGLGATCVSIVLPENGRAGDRWEATFWEASVLVSPDLPFTTPRLMRTVRSSQLKSCHWRPTISLARRPRHAATTTWCGMARPVVPEEGGSRPASAHAVCIADHPAVVPNRWDFGRSVPTFVRAHR